jgi:hypothetical protein
MPSSVRLDSGSARLGQQPDVCRMMMAIMDLRTAIP